jgi:hypothetical protein
MFHRFGATLIANAGAAYGMKHASELAVPVGAVFSARSAREDDKA